MGQSLVEAALYSLVNQFNDRTISHKGFCKTFLGQIHPFRDGNGRTYKSYLPIKEMIYEQL